MLLFITRAMSISPIQDPPHTFTRIKVIDDLRIALHSGLLGLGTIYFLHVGFSLAWTWTHVIRSQVQKGQKVTVLLTLISFPARAPQKKDGKRSRSQTQAN